MGQRVVQLTGRVLVYPLRPTPLAAIVVFTLGLSLGVFAGLLGLPLLLILSIWFVKYLFIVLESTALGATEPPVLSIEMVNPIDEPRPLMMLAVFMVTAGIAGFVGDVFGRGASLIFVLLASILLPASLALLTIERRLLPALDPLRMVRLVMALRGRYALLAAVVAACPTIILLINVTLPALPLVVAATLYTMLLGAHAFGLVLYDNRELLGLDVIVDPARTASRHETERWRRIDRMLDDVYRQARQGKLRAAYAALLKGLDGETVRTDDRLALHERLMRWEETSIALAHARDHVGALIGAGELATAWRMCADCLEVDSSFKPADAEAAFTLARYALERGESGMALLLLEDFDLHYEGRGPVQAAALKAVRLLIEKRRDEAAAGRVIERMRARYGAERLRPELAAYARVIAQRDALL